jgi:N-dimethylarginine dimethylaminohydrolase
MTAPLKKVAVKKPGKSLINAKADEWHYGPSFNPKKIGAIHSTFVQMLKDSGIEVFWMPEYDFGIADSVFTYDASLMTPFGAILMSPGKLLRRGEQNIHHNFYKTNNIPIIGSIETDGLAEAGDTLWLDEKTLVIGRGFRTNSNGIENIKKILDPQEINIHIFDLPVYSGKSACLHLMSLISLVDTNTALVCLPLLPVGLFELLREKNFSLIEAPYHEFEKSNTLSTNVLAIRPRKCIMLDSVPETTAVLRSAGITVKVFNGDALCIGCEGGPTCLTRPLLRTHN